MNGSSCAVGLTLVRTLWTVGLVAAYIEDSAFDGDICGIVGVGACDCNVR